MQYNIFFCQKKKTCKNFNSIYLPFDKQIMRDMTERTGMLLRYIREIKSDGMMRM